MRAADIRHSVDSVFNAKPLRATAHRVVNEVQAEEFGTPLESMQKVRCSLSFPLFSILPHVSQMPAFGEEACRVDPLTQFKIQLLPNNQFNRFTIVFGPCKTAEKHALPVSGIDGAHLAGLSFLSLKTS